MSRFIPAVRRAVRSYSTSPPIAEKTNLAPYFLGAGIAGSCLFYYSTLGSAKSTAEAKAAELAALLAVKEPLPAALSSDEFRNFKLKAINEYNHNTSTFTFELPAGTSSGLSVASALVVKSATEGTGLGKNGKPAIRPYTPVTSPSKEGELELLVKKYPGGVMTTHIHELKVGDELSIKGPIPKFAYTPNEFDTIGLIAGGSGITPMWQIMQAIDANPADKTKAVLVFGNVTEADILLRKEFEDLAARKPNQFKIHFVLDKPPTAWSGLSGYMTSALLGKTLPSPTENIKLFVCGPPPQVVAISGPKKSFKDQGELTGVLAELGYKAEQVYKF